MADASSGVRAVAGRVGRQSIAYTLASAVGPLTGVLLLPVYTRFLSPDDYGLIALLEILSLVFTTVFSLGLTAMIPFYYVDYPAGAERRRGVGSVLIAVTALNAVLAATVALSGAAVVHAILPSVPFRPFVPILAATAFLDPYWIAAGAIFQIREQAFTYSAWSTARIVLSIMLKILFVVVLAQGVYGFILSNLLAAAVTAVFVAPLLWREMDVAFDVPMLRRALAVGGPTVPNNLFSYGFRVVDRAIMDRFVDRSTIGLYYMALRIADVVRLGTDVFVNAWRPVFFKEAGDPRFTAGTLPHVVRLVAMGIVGACLAVSLFSREVVAILASAPYAGAAAFVPLLVGAMALKGLYAFPYLAVWYKKRTAYVPALTAITMIVSVSANLLLMPRWGAMAAAAVQMLSYAVLFALMTVLARRVFPLHFPWKSTAPAAIAAVAAAALGAPLPISAAGVAAKLGLLAGYAGVVVLAGGVRLSDLRDLMQPGALAADARADAR